MADYEIRDVVIVRKEYALRSPTNWGEVRKLIAGVEQELGEAAHWDDIVTVEARDDEIVFWFGVDGGPRG